MAKAEVLYEVEIKGERLMQHNEQLANPLNEYRRSRAELTNKKNKSDEDFIEIARREFQGGLYYDEKLGPYIPGHAINKMVMEGAKRRKLGKLFLQFVMVTNSMIPIQYKGPRKRKEMWETLDANGQHVFADMRLVGVGQRRILRTRPLFRDWSLKFTLRVEAGQVNADDVKSALEAAQSLGLGDGRPMYAGQFALVSVKEVKS